MTDRPLRVLFEAHGSVLTVFHDLDVLLRERGAIADSAYWISDASYFEDQRADLALFRDGKVDFVGEWTLTGRTRFDAGDAAELARLEERYGDPYAWNAILADRRLMFGARSKFRQYYAPNFSHDELRAIMLRSYRAVEALFTEFRPDVVVSFVPADYGGYLMHTAARAHGVPYLHLKTTKVSNFVTLSETVSEDPSHIFRRYRALASDPSQSPRSADARAHLAAMQAEPVRYEGDILRRKGSLRRTLQQTASGFARALYHSVRPAPATVRDDNHVPGIWRTYLDSVVTRPWRERAARREMARRAVSLTDVADAPFLFYPLTTEPEIAIAVYGRDHQNQIETLRRIGQSIPLHWRLVVKEHPRSLGTRRRGYYRKLLEIPNLVFADPDVPPYHWIRAARAVAVISGYSGVEALVLGRPVLVLGDVNYRVLPDTMIRTVGAMSGFADTLRDLMASYAYDEAALVAFFAAVMEESIELNLYSELLAKPDRQSGAAGSRQAQLTRLADYFMRRAAAVRAAPAGACGGSRG